ncbi:hypothetical protein QAD02_002516 [Eretmocerus hayati]|uniref:Uncharacterized protein n=1 Tax=Eretmocerus hayati TaxID=131215 RepID=A0ACC2NJH6_9HYME|nr:hypothetical protein QAD02_002516 [Eretmocerus hayati]
MKKIVKDMTEQLATILALAKNNTESVSIQNAKIESLTEMTLKAQADTSTRLTALEQKQINTDRKEEEKSFPNSSANRKLPVVSLTSSSASTVELLKELNRLKFEEAMTTSDTARQEMHQGLEFNPKTETALKFIERFDDLVRAHDSIETEPNYRPEEIRDAFVNAVKGSTPMFQTLRYSDRWLRPLEELKRIFKDEKAKRALFVIMTTALKHERQFEV